MSVALKIYIVDYPEKEVITLFYRDPLLKKQSGTKFKYGNRFTKEQAEEKAEVRKQLILKTFNEATELYKSKLNIK